MILPTAKAPINSITQPKTPKLNSLCILVCPRVELLFFIRKRIKDGSPPRTSYRRGQQEEMLPSYLVRVPGLINHWNSSLAWVLDQNFTEREILQSLNTWVLCDCKGAEGWVSPHFLYLFWSCWFFQAKTKETSKSLPVCSRKKTLQVHTDLLKTAFFTVLRPQLSVPQMIHFKVRLTRKAEQILFAEGKKPILIEMLDFSRVTLYTFTVEFQPHAGQQRLLQVDI